MNDVCTLSGQMAEELEEYIIKVRQHLHAIPELGFAENKTAAFVSAELRALGFTPKEGVAHTGVVARLDFARPGPLIMLRADMDALPVTEETGLPFASAHAGQMHACGHDGHMAMLLGVASVFSRLRQSKAAASLKGSLLFVFQPAEESPGGAEPMIAEGVLNGVDYCLGAHIWPDVPLGKAGVKEGYLMAALSRFEITLRGKGGHGSQPDLCNDVICAASELTLALQQVVSRRIDPLSPAVLTVGALNAGHTYNVLPSEAKLMGCARTFDKQIYHDLESHVRQITAGVAKGAGLGSDIFYEASHGAVNNDPFVTRVVREAAAHVLGADNVIEPALSMAGEDFACYQEKVPGCLFFLGSGVPGAHPLHNPHFTFPEKILVNGVKIFCRAALSLLGK